MAKDKAKKQHWEEIYSSKDTTCEVSWYQDNPRISIDQILSTGIDRNARIIDIGGGDSRVVDQLLALGFEDLSVLDISLKSLQKAQKRLGDKAKQVTWIESDILQFNPKLHYDLWHDRATFHFFTDQRDITRYTKIAGRFIKPNGYLIISTFSLNGPKKCSGLDVTQYSEDSIKQVFEKDFIHVKSFKKEHITPFKTNQSFLFTIFRRK